MSALNATPLMSTLDDFQVAQALLNLDPDNVVSMNNMGVAHQTVGDAFWQMGRMREAAAKIEGLPVSMRNLHVVHKRRDWIRSAERATG